MIKTLVLIIKDRLVLSYGISKFFRLFNASFYRFHKENEIGRFMFGLHDSDKGSQRSSLIDTQKKK